MKLLEITELDAAIIAEEKGWDYLPACDEGLAAVHEYEAETSALTVPAFKINKRTLRTRLIREAMPLVKADHDAQGIAAGLYQDDAAIAAYPDDEAREEMVWGVVRFCDQACGYTR